MTREEAIKVLQNEVNCAQNDRCSLLCCDSCEFFVTDDQVKTAHETAIAALQQQGNKRNEPLTLDELRNMHGEPVWVQFLDHAVGYWDISNCHNSEFFKFCRIGFILIDEYGKTWLAYRQKP